MKQYKILVINPGSTSTKLSLFVNEEHQFTTDVFHDSSVLKQFKTINDQLDYRMEVVQKFIDDNLHEEISVTSIAKAFYLSETHVIRIFRDKYAETPKQYILRRKIEEAKRMLLETSLQIKEIAMILHFADSYHFSHTFKRYTKYSPEKFRMHEGQSEK